MKRLVSKRHRALILLLAGLLGSELVYVVVGNWFVASRLADLDIRATRTFTAYPGDLRAAELELDPARGVTVRATGVHGRVRLRSLFTGSLELATLDAGRLDVSVATFGDFARTLADTRGDDAGPTLGAASLGTSTFATSGLEIDHFRGTLGTLRVSGVAWHGPGKLSMSSVLFAPRLLSARATARLGRGTLRRSERGAPVGTAEGDFELTVARPDESPGDERRVRLSATLRGDIDDTHALLHFGPTLRISHAVLTTQARILRTGSAGWDPDSVSITAAVSGRGANAGALLELLDAAPSVRWMFEELNGEPYQFELRGSATKGSVNVAELRVETARTRAEGSLTRHDGQTRGAVLMSRGDLRIGLAMEGGNTRVVLAPPPGWLEHATAESPQ
ncbi:MAG TPA: hypothetical protein VMI54_22975 [Polyangiaceae bacterium]|nr:hypothetical protein [Polyangiaceae bacterium]